MVNEKNSIRKNIRQQCLTLSEQTIKKYSLAICQQIVNLPCYKTATHIGVYLALKHEADLQFFIDQAWRDHKIIYLPVITDYEKKIMEFYSYTASTTLELNRYGILEPLISPEKQTHLLDIIITPLVAFDNRLNRLGQGLGYYDRYLSTAHAITVGVGYEIQRVHAVPVEAWDIPLDFVITENSV